MKKSHHVLRVATYNIHKCRGLDRRVCPERILDVLKHINADIIALQEVLSIEGGNRDRDQRRFLADGLGFHFAFGGSTYTSERHSSKHRQQARRLFEEEIVCHGELKRPRIVLGDFNE
jgi:endonuclease/exonuclease/phosphatase family metal-dependent hydrolase